MEKSDIKLGSYYTFSPAKHTEGWTTEKARSLSFKYRDVSPQDMRGKTVQVLSLESDEVFRVIFLGDPTTEYFLCCAMFLELAGCLCSSSDLFNFGCRCGCI